MTRRRPRATRSRRARRAGEHRDHADAGERAQCVARGVVDLAEDHHHEIGAPVGPQPGEHRDQPVGVVERDGGEAVDHVVTRVAADAEQLARAGDHLHLAAQAHQPFGDRRRGLYRHLERLGVVRAAVHVEHHRGARPPPGLVLADHEVLAARAGPPVHPPEIIAHLVGAQGEELAPEVAGDRARGRGLALRRDAATDRDRGDDVVDAGPDHQLRVAGRADRPAGETERVAAARASGPT